MKKLAAIAVSVGVILVIVGLVLVGIYGRDKISSGELNPFVSANLDSADTFVDILPHELGDLKEVSVRVSSYDVYIFASNTDSASVRYVKPLRDDVKIDVSCNGGVLNITQTESNANHWWGLSWFKNHRFIAVYVPQSPHIIIDANAGAVTVDNITCSSVDVTTKAGSVKIDNVHADNVIANTNAGSITVDDVNAKQVSVGTMAGSVKVEEIACDELIVKSDSGSLKVVDINAAMAATLTTGAGSVKCDVKTAILTITTGAGSVKFETNADIIELYTGAGSITGTVDGLKQDYQIEIIKGVGSSNINDQTVVGATKFLKVDTSVGSVKIDFDND